MKTPAPLRAGAGALQDEIRSRNRSPTVTPLARTNQDRRPRREAAAASAICLMIRRTQPDDPRNP